MKRTSGISALVLLAFLAGIFVGRQATGDRPAAPATDDTALPAKTIRKDATRDLASSIQKLLEPVRAARTDDERMRATLALAAAIPVDELEKWQTAGWFGLRESMESLVFERILLDRWFEEDPAGVITHLIGTKHPDAGEMARRWARRDPAGAFAFLRSSAKPKDLEKVIWAAEDVWLERIPQVLADEMSWILEIFEGFYASALVQKMVETQPDLVTSRTEGWPEELRKAAGIALDQAALRKDFSTTLAALAGAPDGKERFARAADAEVLLDHVSQLPEGWFVEALAGKAHIIAISNPAKWLEADLVALGAKEVDARRFRQRAIQQWAGVKPEEALRLLDQDTLTESERFLTVQSSFRALCAENPQRAEELLGLLSDPLEIQLAQEQIEGTRVSAKQAQVSSIPEWIASFSSDTEHANEYAAAVWDSRQATEATAAFHALPQEGKATIAINLLEGAGSEIPPELAAAAYGHLLSHPPEDTDLTPEDVGTRISDVASEWATRDPLAASRWVVTLPEGPARLWAAKNLAARWAEYEPAAARRWVSSLPVGDRFEVVDYLDSGAAWKGED